MQWHCKLQCSQSRQAFHGIDADVSAVAMDVGVPGADGQLLE